MMEKPGKGQWRRVGIALQRFLGFFLSTCFVINCSMLLFLKAMTKTMGLELSRGDIRLAASVTFGNVIFLSLLCAIVDTLRRRVMVERPVGRIIRACERVMKGDLSVRIDKFRSPDLQDGFNVIIDYFNRMVKELAGMETLRTDFIANVSHELKTPLSVIQTYGAMLQQPELPEEKRLEYARTVTDASRRLTSMISNILKLNKLENQNIYPAVQAYDLGEQLCECLLAFEELWEEKGLQLDVSLEENVFVTADPELLALVWNNLFSNAVKFTPPGGRIGLALETEGALAVVRISDTGCGISPEVGKHMFEKFYQGDTSHATAGNGLGLALVKRVIDITGGDISVASEVGKGSVFTVALGRNQDGAV